MKKAIVTITSWVNDLSDLLKSLLVMGILIGLVYNDMFGVIGNIGKLMSNIGDGGLAGLVALVLVVTWWKKIKLLLYNNLNNLVDKKSLI